MPSFDLDERADRLFVQPTREILDVLGPTIEILTPADAGESAPCTLRGVLPPGAVVPLHSHAEPETYVGLSGTAEALTMTASGLEWTALRPGEVLHVPGGAKHAFRNRSVAAAVMIIVTAARLGRFFREVGRPVAGAAGPPSEAAVRSFLETAERYGYWNASREENARFGLTLPAR